jgi:hypothetical protein
MKRLKLVGLALLFLTGCGKQPAPNPPPTVAPQVNEPKVLKPEPELGEVFNLGEFAIQMPIGYELQSQDQRGGIHTTDWHAPAGEGPSGHRLFTVKIVYVPEGKNAPTEEQLRLRPDPRIGFVDYVESEPETVPIGDWNFECVTTTCRAGKKGRELRGFQYVYVGRPCFVIIYQGAKEDEQSYNEASAAARTFRRK